MGKLPVAAKDSGSVAKGGKIFRQGRHPHHRPGVCQRQRGELHQDYERWLEELAPHEPLNRYQHNLTGEDNGDAHLKRQVMGREVAVTEARLDFGPWEAIFYGEFDGRRRKRVLVKIIGE